MRPIIMYLYDSEEYYKITINHLNDIVDIQKLEDPYEYYSLKITKADWEKYYAYYALIGSDALKHYVKAYLNSKDYLVGTPRKTYRDDIVDAVGLFAKSVSVAVANTPRNSGKSYLRDFAKRYLSNH